jgi:hypothetical protein
MAHRHRVDDHVKVIAGGLHRGLVRGYEQVMRAHLAASSALSAVRLIAVTCAPIATASFTAIWPSPPSPITPTRLPAFTPQRFKGA